MSAGTGWRSRCSLRSSRSSTHSATGVEDGEWSSRIVQVNPNASTLSHAELDDADELPHLAIVGGYCGTDASHVAALAGL